MKLDEIKTGSEVFIDANTQVERFSVQGSRFTVEDT